MSRENVEIVAAAYEALADEGLDRWIEYWRRDLEHRGIEGAPDDRGPIHGKDAMRAYVRDWIDLFDDFRIEPIELIDAGENTVVAILRFGGRAKLSRIKTDQTIGGPSFRSVTERSPVAASTRPAPRPSKPPGSWRSA